MKVILIGANGRMGKSLQQYFNEQSIVVLPIDIDNRNRLKDLIGDVIVDFSCSDALKENLEFAKSKNIPIVVATTNHSKENLKLMNMYKHYLPIFYAPNMSIQFNLVASFIGKLKLLNDCDFVVEEAHHKNKKDKPSGSAKLLIKKLNNISIKPKVYCVRAGNIVGEHSLKIYDQMENLEIKHTVLDRKVFCVGTLKACEFIIKKQNGLYNMENIIDSL